MSDNLSRTTTSHTIDGHPVTEGLLVWDYNLRPARVIGVDHTANDGTVWWETDTGMFDGSRMWVRHPSTRQQATVGGIPPREVRIGYHRVSDDTVSSCQWKDDSIRARFVEEVLANDDIDKAWWRDVLSDNTGVHTPTYFKGRP